LLGGHEHSNCWSNNLSGGDSTNWGGIELIDKNDFALRYAYCFPMTPRWRAANPVRLNPSSLICK
jgi:hypothetical protein